MSWAGPIPVVMNTKRARRRSNIIKVDAERWVVYSPHTTPPDDAAVNPRTITAHPVTTLLTVNPAPATPPAGEHPSMNVHRSAGVFAAVVTVIMVAALAGSLPAGVAGFIVGYLAVQLPGTIRHWRVWRPLQTGHARIVYTDTRSVTSALRDLVRTERLADAFPTPLADRISDDIRAYAWRLTNLTHAHDELTELRAHIHNTTGMSVTADTLHTTQDDLAKEITRVCNTINSYAFEMAHAAGTEMIANTPTITAAQALLNTPADDTHAETTRAQAAALTTTLTDELNDELTDEPADMNGEHITHPYPTGPGPGTRHLR